MRRNYGLLPTSFWDNNDIQELSDQAKLLATYLSTGPHSNMLGCFRLPQGYITEDLKWDVAKIKDAFRELSEIAFLTQDDRTAWIVIHDFLKSNPIQNPRQGIGIEKLFNFIPDQSTVLKPIIYALFTYGKYLNEGFVYRLNTMLGNHETLREDCVADQEQDQVQEQEQNQEQIYMSGKPDVLIHRQDLINRTKTSALLNQQAIEVLQFLNEKAGRNYRPEDPNLQLIIARLNSGASVMDCRQVIAKKTREWKGDEKMDVYLRPATLFNATKFAQYLGELVLPKEEEKSSS